MSTMRANVRVAMLAGGLALAATTAGLAQGSAKPAAAPAPAAAPVAGTPAAAPTAAPTQAPRIEKFTGVWVEGGGFDISYGKDYEACAQRCLSTKKCVMIEYYKPEKKCNMYDAMRPRLKGGSSFVGIRQ